MINNYLAHQFIGPFFQRGFFYYRFSFFNSIFFSNTKCSDLIVIQCPVVYSYFIEVGIEPKGKKRIIRFTKKNIQRRHKCFWKRNGIF